MLAIRLSRVGKKNKAQFRIILQEHTAAPGGRHVEVLGSYNPHSKEIILKEDRITYWLSQGAKASVTVHNILVSKGLLKEEKIAVKMSKKTKKKDGEEGAEEEKKEEGTEKAGEVKAEEKKEETPAPKEESAKEEKAEEATKEEKTEEKK